MVYSSKPRRLRSVLWLPFVYVYWFIQNFIAAYAFLQIVLMRPRVWCRTKKTGVVDS